jgi:tetratricopeptide (TPR) repeat protein
MERYKKALAYLEQAQRLVPGDPTIAEHLGDVYSRLNKTGKALELYRRALELAPDKQAVQQKINDLEGL